MQNKKTQLFLRNFEEKNQHIMNNIQFKQKKIVVETKFIHVNYLLGCKHKKTFKFMKSNFLFS